LTKLHCKPGASGHCGQSGDGKESGFVPKTSLSCVLLADRHHGLTEGVRDAALKAGADAFLLKRAIATTPTRST